MQKFEQHYSIIFNTIKQTSEQCHQRRLRQIFANNLWRYNATFTSIIGKKQWKYWYDSSRYRYGRFECRMVKKDFNTKLINSSFFLLKGFNMFYDSTKYIDDDGSLETCNLVQQFFLKFIQISDYNFELKCYQFRNESYSQLTLFTQYTLNNLFIALILYSIVHITWDFSSFISLVQ